jgi:hypothetical protein
MLWSQWFCVGESNYRKYLAACQYRSEPTRKRTKVSTMNPADKFVTHFFYRRVQSDSATYGGGSMGEGVGPYLFVHHKYPNPFSPEYNNATLWRLIGDWAEGYANLHMPYRDQQAVMFNYGNASYVSNTLKYYCPLTVYNSFKELVTLEISLR